MANGADTAQIIMEDKSSQQSNTLRNIAVAVIVSCVVAIAALIVAVVGISRQSSIVVNPSGGSDSGGGNSYTFQSAPATSAGGSDGKIWRFHIGHFGGNTQYLDEASGQVRGYDLDVVNKVCQIANKNCIIAWDLYENCWNSQAGERPRGGVGLMGNWYDACIGWLQTRDRKRTYDFSSAIGKAYPVGLFVKAGTTLAGYPSLANRVVGLLDGWYADEHCLARYSQIMNFDQNDANFVIHYQTEGDMVNALISGEINVAFAARTPYLLQLNTVTLIHSGDFSVNECVSGGPSLMMPKANTELNGWFNSAFQRLLNSRDYDAICQDLTIAHGDMPGYDPDDYCVQ